MYDTKEENLEAIKCLRIDSIKSISLAQLDEVMTACDIAMREYCQYSCARCPIVDTCSEDCNNFYKMAFFYDIYYRLFGHFTCDEFMYIHAIALYGMNWYDDMDEILEVFKDEFGIEVDTDLTHHELNGEIPDEYR